MTNGLYLFGLLAFIYLVTRFRSSDPVSLITFNNLRNIKLLISFVESVPDLDTTGLFDVQWSHDICESGVIAKEFESQLDDLRKENAERAKVEEKQSEELIRELMREDGLQDPQPAFVEPDPTAASTSDSQVILQT